MIDVRYDGDSDAVRIDLVSDGELAAANTEELSSPSGGTFVFEYDDAGNLLSVGLRAASKVMDHDVLIGKAPVPES